MNSRTPSNNRWRGEEKENRVRTRTIILVNKSLPVSAFWSQTECVGLSDTDMQINETSLLQQPHCLALRQYPLLSAEPKVKGEESVLIQFLLPGRSRTRCPGGSDESAGLGVLAVCVVQPLPGWGLDIGLCEESDLDKFHPLEFRFRSWDQKTKIFCVPL